jgi:Holliday junction resolvase
MSNKATGTSFEKEFCKLASEHGFWAHMLQGNTQGQPSDVILAKNGKAALIDCKVCENNKFLFSRIEENQDLAMTK